MAERIGSKWTIVSCNVEKIWEAHLQPGKISGLNPVSNTILYRRLTIPEKKQNPGKFCVSMCSIVFLFLHLATFNGLTLVQNFIFNENWRLRTGLHYDSCLKQ